MYIYSCLGSGQCELEGLVGTNHNYTKDKAQLGNVHTFWNSAPYRGLNSKFIDDDINDVFRCGGSNAPNRVFSGYY